MRGLGYIHATNISFVFLQVLNITILDLDLYELCGSTYVYDNIIFWTYVSPYPPPWLDFNNCTFNATLPHSVVSSMPQNIFMFRRSNTERSNRGFKLLVEHVPDPTYWTGMI